MTEPQPPLLPAPPPSPDALVPQAIAERAEQIGAAKARMELTRLFTLAVLAGAFIALGAIFATVVGTGAGALPFGVGRLLAGIVFSLGLILVIVGGAELFTGNNLMVMALASRVITAGELARAWTVVYAGNLVGGIGTAALAFLAGHHEFGGGAVGASALAIGAAKSGLAPVQAFFLGVLCNVLVCLAVWLCLGARSTTDRILAIVPPIAAFVAAGFEHSVANAYFIPFALMVKWGAAEGFWHAIGRVPADFAGLDLTGFVANMVPVTLGNMVGGGVLVGAVYWFVYLRGRRG
jgi:formate/nitrite transporter